MFPFFIIFYLKFFQENSHRGDLQNPFTWKTRQFGESNMNLNIPAKTHTQSRSSESVTGILYNLLCMA